MKWNIKENFLLRKSNINTPSEKFELSQQQFNLKLSEEGLYKSYGRIQGEYPIFAPRESKLAAKLVEEAHV